jgi:hypothetical protein
MYWIPNFASDGDQISRPSELYLAISQLTWDEANLSASLPSGEICFSDVIHVM